MARHHERRSGQDRRQVEQAPPRQIERRRSVEARQPDLVELVLSEADWKQLFGSKPTRVALPAGTGQATRTPATADPAADAATPSRG